MLGASKSISGFDPRSIPGCAIWLDASDSNTITLSGSNVTQINDKSGNARNLPAVSGLANATVSSAFQNGLNVLNFSGNGLYRTAADSIVYPLDAYVIVALKSLTAQADVLGMGPTNADNFNSLLFSETQVGYWKSGSSSGVRNVFSSTPETSTGFLLIQWSIANNNFLLRRNGTLLAQSSSFTYTLPAGSVLQIGFRHTNLNQANFSGYLGEVIVFDSQLGDVQRQQVEGYLSWKWGLETIPQVPLVPGPSPVSIPGCTLWLDGADSSTITGSSPVTAWRDKSSNAYSFTGTGAVVSNSGLYFNGSSYLTNGSITAIPAPYTVFAVGSSTSQPNTFQRMISGGVSGITPYDAILAVGTSNTTPFVWFGYTNNWLANPYMTGSAYSGTNLFITGGTVTSGTSPTLFGYGNGIQQSSNVGSANTATSLTGLNIGGGYSSAVAGSQPWYGNINEIIIYNTVLTTAQRQQVESYLSTKWGVQVTPYTPLLSSPANVPGCVMWLDGADASTLTLSGSNVTQWRDKSGNGYNGTATNASVGSPVAPTYVTNSINGLPAVTMSGTSYFTGSTDVNSTTLTAFFVGNCVFGTGGSTQQRILGLGVTGLDDYSSTLRPIPLAVVNSGTTLLAYRNANMATATVVSGTNFLGCCLFDGTSNYMYKDGKLGTQVASSGTFTTSIYGVGSDAGVQNSGGAAALGTNCLVGKIGEMIVFNTALNTTQRQSVERYLSLKWGLSNVYTSIPGSIPGLALWLDGADPSTMTLSGSNVTQWRDKSTKGYNATSVTNNGGTAPVYNSATRGLQFVSSSSNALALAQGFGDTVANNTSTFFFVAQRTIATGFQAILNGGFAGTNNLLVGFDGNGMSIAVYAGGVLSNAITAYSAPDPIRIYTQGVTGAASFINVLNGIVIGTGETGNYAGNTQAIVTSYPNPELGRRYGQEAGNVTYHNFNLFEMIAVVPAVTTDQRQAVESYLANKWGLSVPTQVLPVTHPFTSIRPFTRYFNPTDIPDCILWLDGADTTTMIPSNPSSGTSITSWRDKSSNGVTYSSGAIPNYTANTAGSPVYVTGGGLNFNPSTPAGGTFTNGVSQSLNAEGEFPLNVTGFTAFAIAKATGTMTSYNAYFTWSSSVEFMSFDAFGGSPGAGYGSGLYTDSGGLNTVAASTTLGTSTQIQTLRSTTTGATFYVNGTLSNTTAFSYTQVGSSVASNFWIAGQAPGNRTFSGTIYELLLFNTALSTGQRQQIEGYLAQKWGISASLPTHPFKTFPPSTVIPFLPTNISSCVLWLDAADTSAMTLSGSNVTQWRDKSSNALVMQQMGATSIPTTSTTSSPNGLRTINFTSSQSLMSTTNLTLNGPISIFAVFNAPSGSSMFFLEHGFTGSGTQQSGGFYFFGGNGTYWDLMRSTIQRAASIGSVGSAVFSNSVWYQVGLVDADATTNLSDLTLTTNGTLRTPSWYNVGGQGNGPVVTGSYAAPFYINPVTHVATNTYYGEIIIYDTAISASQRRQVEGYLAWKWGLVSSLPTKTATVFTHNGADGSAGALQNYTVPAGVSSLYVAMWGAGGASLVAGQGNGRGGAGAYIQGTLAVTPGETLSILVGGGGPGGATGGFGGGGDANNGGGTYAGGPASDGGNGSAGGGRSAIRRSGTDIVTVGGGGGAGYNQGGAAAWTGTATAGTANGGGGGTPTAGGAYGSGGNPTSFGVGTAGSQFQGGYGNNYGGGGGGGWYGGGGGATTGGLGGDGGGGSSYTAGLTSASGSNGSGGTPGGTTLSYYVAGVAVGGNANSASYAGGPGLVVLSTVPLTSLSSTTHPYTLFPPPHGYSVPAVASLYSNSLWTRFYNIVSDPSISGPGSSGWGSLIGTAGAYTPIYYQDGDGRIGQSDYVGVISKGFMYSATTTVVTFRTVSDDGIVLFFNGSNVLQNWTYHGDTQNDSASVTLPAGYTPIELRFFEWGGGFTCELYWSVGSTGTYTGDGAGRMFHTAASKS